MCFSELSPTQKLALIILLCCWHSSIDAFKCIMWSTQPLPSWAPLQAQGVPFLGQLEEGMQNSWSGTGIWNIEILLKSACQAKRTLVYVWLGAGTPWLQHLGFHSHRRVYSVWIKSREWTWSIPVQRTPSHITCERPAGLCAAWSCRISLPGKNCINEPCSWRIPSFEVQVRMENKPCLLPLCSECHLFLGDSN